MYATRCFQILFIFLKAGILLNGLLLCQQQTASSNIQHGPQPFKFEDDLNTLVSNLQKQYESTLQKIKDTANKAVKVIMKYLSEYEV